MFHINFACKKEDDIVRDIVCLGIFCSGSKNRRYRHVFMCVGHAWLYRAIKQITDITQLVICQT